MPLFFLTPVAGYASDRFDRRHVACVALAVDFCIAVSIAVFTWTDTLTLPLCFVLAAAHGSARVFSGASMSAITPNIVPTSLLPRAIAFGSIGFTGGQVIGPAVGGLLFAANATLPYVVSAVLLLVSAVLVLSIRPVRSSHRSDLHPVRQMIEGFTFVWRSRFLLGCISLDLFAVLFAGATALLPVYARDILHVGPEGLGVMRAASAVGAGLVALYLSFRPFSKNVGVKMLWAVAGVRCRHACLRPFAQPVPVARDAGAAWRGQTWFRCSFAALSNSSIRLTKCAGGCRRSRRWPSPPRTSSAKCNRASPRQCSAQRERLCSVARVR